MMIVPKVAGGVKELLRDNRGLDADLSALVEDRLAVHAGIRLLRSDVVNGRSGGVKTAISFFKKQSHVGRDTSVGVALVGGIALFVAKEQLIRGIQVDKTAIRRKRANTLVRGLGQKCDESHEVL